MGTGFAVFALGHLIPGRNRLFQFASFLFEDAFEILDVHDLAFGQPAGQQHFFNQVHTGFGIANQKRLLGRNRSDPSQKFRRIEIKNMDTFKQVTCAFVRSPACSKGHRPP